MSEGPNQPKRDINTEGAAYAEGDVTTNQGDFVGRDKAVFGDVKAGILSSGSGDINLFMASLSEAIGIIRSVIPQEQSSAVHRFEQALVQLGRYQKMVNELKQVHNILHRMENDLMMIESTIDMNPGSTAAHPINFRSLQFQWSRLVRPSIIVLEEFAAIRMKFLDETPFKVSGQTIDGPFWVINLYQKRIDLEASIEERNEYAVVELVSELLNTCRENLFRIDLRLLEAVEKLDQFSNSILKVIEGND